MATTTIADLIVKISVAFGGAQKGIDQAKKGLIGLGKTSKDVGSQMSSFSKKLATGLIAKKAFTTFKDFETAMARLGAVSGLAGKDLDVMGQHAKKMASTFGISVSEVVDGMTSMAKTGISTADSLKIMPDIMKFAKVAGDDFAHSLGLIEGSLKIFGLGMKDTKRVTDVFTTALKMSKQSSKDFATAMSYVGPAASLAGQSVEAVSGALAILAERSIKGSSAGTGLARVFTELKKPSDKAAATMKTFGINVRDSAGNIKPILDIVKEFQSKLGHLTKAQQDNAISSIFGQQAIRTFGKLMSATPEEIKKYQDALQNAGGATDKFFGLISKTTEEKLKAIQSKLEIFAINIMTHLKPAFEGLVQNVGAFIDLLAQPEVSKFIADLLTLGVAVYGIVKAYRILVTTIALVRAAMVLLNLVFVANPIGLIITAVGLLIAAFVYLYNNSETVRNGLAAAWNFLKANWQSLMMYFMPAIGLLIKAFTSIVQNWETIKTRAKAIWESIKSGLSNAWNAMIAKIQSVKSSITSILTNLASSALKWGRDMFVKFGNGIVAGFRYVKQKVIDAANWVKSKLGFSVPDSGPLKDADKWMPDMMKLMARGIEMGIPKLQMAVGDVASTLDFGSNGYGTSTTNNVSVYPRQANLDSRGLHRELARMAWLNGGAI